MSKDAKTRIGGFLLLLIVLGCKQAEKINLNEGEDVYIAGIQSTGARYMAAAYWKNGSPTFLTDGTKDAAATGVIFLLQEMNFVIRNTIDTGKMRSLSSFLPILKMCWVGGKCIE